MSLVIVLLLIIDLVHLETAFAAVPQRHPLIQSNAAAAAAEAAAAFEAAFQGKTLLPSSILTHMHDLFSMQIKLASLKLAWTLILI